MPFKILAATIIAATLPALSQSQTPTPCPEPAATKAVSARNRASAWLNKATGGAAGTPAAGNPAGCPAQADAAQPVQATPAGSPAPSALAATGGAVIASGAFSGTFLAKPGGSFQGAGTTIQWWYDDRTSLPQIFAQGREFGQGGAMLHFEGRQEGKPGQADYFLKSDYFYRVTIADGKFTLAKVTALPAGLLNLDGKPPEQTGPKIQPMLGSLQIIPWDNAQLAQMGYKDAERIARLTAREGQLPITVIQNHGDPKNFWRVANDAFKAYVYNDATNEVTPLLRGNGDPTGTWKTLDSTGNVKGVYKADK